MTVGIVTSLILMVLKLMNYIDWSWFYVALPALVEIVVSVVVFAAVVTFYNKRW